MTYRYIFTTQDSDGILTSSTILNSLNDRASIIFLNDGIDLHKKIKERIPEETIIYVVGLHIDPSSLEKIAEALVKKNISKSYYLAETWNHNAKLPFRDTTLDEKVSICEKIRRKFRNKLNSIHAAIASINADFEDTPAITNALENYEEKYVYDNAAILRHGLTYAHNNFGFKKNLVKYFAKNRLPIHNKELLDMASKSQEKFARIIIGIDNRIKDSSYFSLCRIPNYGQYYSLAVNYLSLKKKHAIMISEIREKRLLRVITHNKFHDTAVVRIANDYPNVESHKRRVGVEIILPNEYIMEGFIGELNNTFSRT